MITPESPEVYPQINIDVNNIYTVKLFDIQGNEKFDEIGVGRTFEEARSKAKAVVDEQMKQYNKGE